MLELSHDQKSALQSLIDWYKNPTKAQFITLGGYAGTGKTTLIAQLRQELSLLNPKLSVAFCSYTGKATRVLRSKLSDSSALRKGDSVSTIHSLIYSPIENDKAEIVGWERKKEVGSQLIIVDEASMIDADIWQDLLSYRIPIIAVGDHGQLPPIKGSFNLMEKPELIITEIHRQAKDNPIIKLSMLAREEGKIPVGKFGPGVLKVSRADSDTQELIGDELQRYRDENLILCGYNHTRVNLNKHIRAIKEREDPNPMKGDRVICLRNNHEKEIYNGMLGTIVSIRDEGEDWYMAEIQMDENADPFKGLILKSQFNNLQSLNFTEDRRKTIAGDLFDYGYAITVHKAQGSQAPKVLLFEERFKQMDDEMWRRWLYTAVTRAERELLIIGD